MQYRALTIKLLNLIRMDLVRQVLAYGIIGSVCAGIDTALYYSMTRWISIDPLLANFASVNVGILASFILNANFNFRKKNKIQKRLLSFYAVGYLGLGLSTAMLWLGSRVLMIDDFAVKVISVFVVAAFQFVLNKIFTFGMIK